MKAYKGFNKDMTCRGFQYKEGGNYETDKEQSCHAIGAAGKILHKDPYRGNHQESHVNADNVHGERQETGDVRFTGAQQIRTPENRNNSACYRR